MFIQGHNVVASSCRSSCPFAVSHGLPKVPRGNRPHHWRRRIFWLSVSSTTKYPHGVLLLDRFRFSCLYACTCLDRSKTKVNYCTHCSGLKMKNRFIPLQETLFLKPVNWGMVTIHVTKDNVLFLNIYLLYLFEYTVVVFEHTRREHQILLQMVVSHHVVAGN
jgi:hypothetical protein